MYLHLYLVLKICNHSYQSYAFVHLDLTNSKIIGKPVCMAKSTVHQNQRWEHLVTMANTALANGDTEGSAFQFLLFDTETGTTL